MKHFDEILYIPADMDMVEIAMEIQSQFKENSVVKVMYDEDCDEFDIEAGDLLGYFTTDSLRKQGYLSEWS